MPWLLGGYMWLYLHRIFEFWTFLGEVQLERLYMIGVLVCWAVLPGKTWVPNRMHLAILFYTLALLAAWFNSPHPHELGQKVWDDHWKVGVFFVLLLTTVSDERRLRLILVLFFVSLFLYQAHSLLEFANGRYEYRMKTMRMKGVDFTFGDPNTFAATLLHVLPFLVPFWLCTKSSSTRWMIAGYVALTLLCVVLTGSRRALLGVGFLTFVLVLFSKRRWSLLLLLLLLAPAAFMVMRDDLQTRFLTIIDPSVGPSNAQTSAMSRWYFFLQGMQLWGENPLVGVGPGAFGAAAGHGMQAHNLYAQTAAELGTFGVLAIGFTVFCFWRNAAEVKRLYRQHPWWEKDFPYHVARSTWLAVVLLLFMGIGGHNLYRYNWLWFGAFQIIALHIIRKRAAAEASAPVPADPEPAGEVSYQYAT